jgi:arylsulfatase A
MRLRRFCSLIPGCVVCLLVWFSIARAAEPSSARPPNIIHIIGDDVGYDDLSCFGAKDIRTPNLDRLAAQGMKFTSFYAPSPVCTASRAAILTGCYAQRVSLPNVLFPDSKIGLNSDEITIAELLKKRGYATALIGKWHLGWQPEFLPPNHGFDLFLGIPYPNDHVPERLGPDGKSRGFPPMPLIRGTNIIQQPAQLAALPERFTAEAVRFIEDNRARPFYLHLANVETHTPWFTSARFHGKSAAGVYGDAVQCLDWTVGEVLATLDRLGLAENTLVVFSSDNGPLVHRYPELEGIFGHAAAVDTNRMHLLREGKYQAMWEGGTRVSAIMRWPGKISGGSTCNEIVAGFDLFTTFANLAGATVPTDRTIDGKDVTPLMFGERGARSPHEVFYYYQGFRLAAVRSGKWKLVFQGGTRNAANTREMLFDLESDLGEKHDVAAANREIVEKLRALAEKARDDIGDASRNREGKNRRASGKV